MADEKVCEQLGEELAELKSLRAQLGVAFEAAKVTRDFSACTDLRRRISAIMNGGIEGQETEISKMREWMLPQELAHLKLVDQYFEQSSLPGFTHLFDNDSDPVIERDGKKYLMPTWREVQKVLRENRKIIKEKSDQGFTKMLIVPFGCDLGKMAEAFRNMVMDLDLENPDDPKEGVFGAKGPKVRFDRDGDYYPAYIADEWIDGGLVYYPKRYSRQNHGGLIKEEAIKEKGAWQICFVEDLPDISQVGKVVGGRKQIDSRGTWIKGQPARPTVQQLKEALDDKQKKRDPEKYKHETGMIPECYLWMQMNSLTDERPVLMDFRDEGICLTSCLDVKRLHIPTVYWSGAGRRIDLEAAIPDRQGYAVRTSVNFKCK